jgi:hypothetical protein
MEAAFRAMGRAHTRPLLKYANQRCLTVFPANVLRRADKVFG